MQLRFTFALLFVLSFAACADTPPVPAMEPRFAVSVSQGYAQRRLAYLEHCNAKHGPGMGGIHGQPCRVYKGETTYHEEGRRLELDFGAARRSEHSDPTIVS